ncbi:MAG: ABC transporter ATP-binding protein [Oscillospiraceae bacterium]
MSGYENAIEVKGLTKKYDGFTLDNVDITVPKGTIMGFVGQNGAGKTTTIRSLLNIITPDSGSISLFGMDLKENESAIKERLAVVFDELPFHDCLNADQLNKIMREIYKQWNSDTFYAYLDRFALPRKKKFSQFSKGMKMKLQIAAALSHNAELLIMDEATSGLDPVVRSEMLDVFMEYIQDENHSILMSSHITSDLERVADSLTFIHSGKIIMSDYKDVILENHRVIKCSEKSAADIDGNDIVSIRKSDFGSEVMVKNFSEHCGNYSGMVADKTTLDEILLFYVKGMNSREWTI